MKAMVRNLVSQIAGRLLSSLVSDLVSANAIIFDRILMLNGEIAVRGIRVEDYSEANTASLLRHRNGRGPVIDGDAGNTAALQKRDIYWRHDLNAASASVTRDNVNKLIRSGGSAYRTFPRGQAGFVKSRGPDGELHARVVSCSQLIAEQPFHDLQTCKTVRLARLEGLYCDCWLSNAGIK
jgi:hypothetical protein